MKDSLTSAPTGKWQLVGTIAAPDSPKVDGPGLDDDGYQTCFSHSAEGALFAAVNIYAMSTDSRLAPLIPKLSLVPGIGRDAAIKNAELGQNAPGSSARVQVVGFKIDAYSRTVATVDVVFQDAATGRLVSVPTLLGWSAGDWKGITDKYGDSPVKAAEIQNLGGYTAWSGA